ncbi:MAG: hypothetical protein IPL34_18435 [Thiofilum sp.]|uniref:hypothetical protein n=1 Tax=Thiofilum sp. TaxID=2212733 RepID=UPI0025FF52AB|nr:hypothetical protein [Thiofilum sp.]MBK8455271.1 hypothetical protein [Thiofilum sp.]
MNFRVMETLLGLLPSQRRKQHQARVNAQVHHLIQTMQANSQLPPCCQFPPKPVQSSQYR